MNVRRQRGVVRGLLVAAAAVWTGLSGLCLAVVHDAGRSWFEELTAVATVLPVVFAGYAFLAQRWPATSVLPRHRAVAEIRVGRTAVGAAYRHGGRLVVTSTRVVNDALGRPREEAARPADHARLTLFFPAGAGTGDDIFTSARVEEWGPARQGTTRNDVVVLRTVERLPRRIPRLRVAAGSYAGPVNIVLPPHDPLTGGGSSVLAAQMRRDEVVTARSGPVPLPAGAPVLSVDPDDPALGGEVVGLLDGDSGSGSGRTVPSRTRPPRLPSAKSARTDTATTETGGATPVVAAEDVRALVRTVSRRELLRGTAVAGGIMALGAAGTVLGSRGAPASAKPTLLRGAGWRELFTNEHVLEHLRGHGFEIDPHFPKLSGVQSLQPGMDLTRYDFMTAPNQVIAEELSARPDVIFRGASPQQICTEDMVVLASREVAEGLARTERLVRPRGGVACFDVRGYLRDRRREVTWAGIGATGVYNAGSPVQVACSNPLRAGGGQMFLWLLAEVARQDGLGVAWLWESGGPLYGWARGETMQLFADLENGSEQMVFVYEHDAVDFLMERPGRAGRFVILRTFPTMRLNQMLLSRNAELAEIFADPSPELAQILVREFHLRVRGRETAVDDLLRGALRDSALPPGERARPVPSGPRNVVVNVGDMQRLLGRMSSYSTSGRS